MRGVQPCVFAAGHDRRNAWTRTERQRAGSPGLSTRLRIAGSLHLARLERRRRTDLPRSRAERARARPGGGSKPGAERADQRTGPTDYSPAGSTGATTRADLGPGVCAQRGHDPDRFRERGRRGTSGAPHYRAEASPSSREPWPRPVSCGAAASPSRAGCRGSGATTSGSGSARRLFDVRASLDAGPGSNASAPARAATAARTSTAASPAAAAHTPTATRTSAARRLAIRGAGVGTG